ncbi:MAG TPA: glycine zipper domain-containing protein [Candidatus Limnocylindria bacterium]|jgi:hypothetical protein|nr:glycine zipper domain-containing protein [Candidatus Limnocylindria bacterium]
MTALAAFALALTPLVASAQVGPGTELVGNMDQSLDSGSAQVGQRFTMHDVHSQDNNIHNAVIYGHVAQVQHAGQGTPGKIELAFDKLRTASGASYALSARATNVQVNTKNNTLKEVGGALAGMIVGNVLGKWVGTNIGGIVGAGGGYMYAKNNRQNVTIPSNANVTVQVLRAYRQGTR